MQARQSQRRDWLRIWGSLIAGVLIVAVTLALAWYFMTGPGGENAVPSDNVPSLENQFGELSGQAKISITEASQAATSAVPGTIQRYDLAKQGSAIVYEITVQPTAGGAPVQVLVDATTGKVLRTQPVPTNPPEK
jgi:hypothetical protein